MSVSFKSSFHVKDIDQITVTASSAQLTDISCKAARFKAASGNSGNLYLAYGEAAATDAGFELAPGDSLEIQPCFNLSEWRVIGTLNDILCYIAYED